MVTGRQNAAADSAELRQSVVWNEIKHLNNNNNNNNIAQCTNRRHYSAENDARSAIVCVVTEGARIGIQFETPDIKRR